MSSSTSLKNNNFPRRARIRSPLEFERILKQGARRTGQHFIVMTATETEDLARLGLVASRRAGNAPQRNRAKRLVREWFRARRGSMTRPLVVIIRSGACQLTLGEATQQLDRLVTQRTAAK